MKSSNIITHFEDLEKLKNEKIVLLYSGGLDGTYLLAKLRERNFKHVYALTIDIGGENNIKQILDYVERFGYHSFIANKREEFVDEYVKYAIKAKGLFFGRYPISASLSRPLTAKEAVNQSNILDSSVILHTANCTQNSMRRFNNALRLLKYDGHYGSPFHSLNVSRKEKIQYLEGKGLKCLFNTHSTDVNIWCREFESGNFENPEYIDIPESMYEWTKVTNPNNFTELKIEFSNGVPVRVDDKLMNLENIILYLNKKVGEFGIGRYIGLEEISNSQKVLEIREAPAAQVLIDAFGHLENATLNNESILIKTNIEQMWIREASEGRWFDNLRLALQSFIDSLSSHVSGIVKYNLSVFNLKLTGISSIKGRYISDRSQYGG